MTELITAPPLESLITYQTTMPTAKWKDILSTSYSVELVKLRHIHIERCGFPIITTEVVSQLADFLSGKRVLEVGAGSGYLAYHLKQLGCNLVAVDSYETSYGMSGKESPFTRSPDVVSGDALEYVTPEFDVIITSWPDYNTSFSKRVVDKMRSGQILVYQGEGWGGCTGNDAFHDTLSNDFIELTDVSNLLNDSHVRFYGIHDSWTVYVKD